MQARLPGLRRHRPSGEKQFTGREGLPYRGRNTPSERNGPSEKEGPSGEARFAGGKAVRRRGCPIEGGIPPSERNGPSKKEGPSGKARFAGGKAVRRRGGAALSREEYPRRRETGRRRKRVHRERHGLRGGGKSSPRGLRERRGCRLSTARPLVGPAQGDSRPNTSPASVVAGTGHTASGGRTPTSDPLHATVSAPAAADPAAVPHGARRSSAGADYGVDHALRHRHSLRTAEEDHRVGCLAGMRPQIRTGAPAFAHRRHGRHGAGRARRNSSAPIRPANESSPMRPSLACEETVPAPDHVLRVELPAGAASGGRRSSSRVSRRYEAADKDGRTRIRPSPPRAARRRTRTQEFECPNPPGERIFTDAAVARVRRDGAGAGSCSAGRIAGRRCGRRKKTIE